MNTLTDTVSYCFTMFTSCLFSSLCFYISNIVNIEILGLGFFSITTQCPFNNHAQEKISRRHACQGVSAGAILVLNNILVFYFLCRSIVSFISLFSSVHL